MAVIKRFEEIQSWQKARELVREVYKIRENQGINRDFPLRDQLCRAAISTMTNIAEGFGRKSDKDFAHFLDISRGSACEVQSLLYVTLDLKYIQPSEFDKIYLLAEETISLIARFSAYLRSS